MSFNLDLSLIETVLKDAGFTVSGALEMPKLLQNPLIKDTLFVLSLGDYADDSDEIGGPDIQQDTEELFAVVIGLKASGDITGMVASPRLHSAKESIKSELVGLIFGDFEPIKYQAGRLIEVNRDKQNVLYQLQFKTTHTVVTQVKHYDR